MAIGDQVLIYHSRCRDVGILGIGTIIQPAFADPIQFDPISKYVDQTATKENPNWFSVQVAFKCKISPMIKLSELKSNENLAEFRLLKRGSRLSVMPVEEGYWKHITCMRKSE